MFKRNAAALAFSAAALAFGSTAIIAQELPETTIRVIGSAVFSNTFNQLEKQFWTEEVPTASNGKVTVELTSITQSGLKGPEIIRLLSTGALDIAFGDFGMVSGDNAYFEGLDLSGVITDFDTLEEATQAFKPVLSDIFEQNNLKLMALTPFPGFAFFCSTPVQSLEDIKGKKVRVYSRAMTDFVNALDGIPVTIPFGDVIPALQTGVADCGITGTYSGNNAGWAEVTEYLYTLPVGSGISFYGYSKPAYEKLDPALRSFMDEQFAKLEKMAWDLTREQTEAGILCNTGGDCPTGKPGKMKLVEPSEADIARAHEIAHDVVLPAWAERCGEECVTIWNETVGKVAGIAAE